MQRPANQPGRVRVLDQARGGRHGARHADAHGALLRGLLLEAAHQAGLRVVYHTCGGMMPFLERIADMRPDAVETFTPRDMGGDADLDEAKRRVGGRVCMVGGFDQFHHFTGRCGSPSLQDGLQLLRFDDRRLPQGSYGR